MAKFNWEKLDYRLSRAKVPGGWLVKITGYAEHGIAFYPDPNHTWDGGSLP